MRLHLHIEEISVDGLDLSANGAPDLAHALHGRLTALLVGQPVSVVKARSFPTAVLSLTIEARDRTLDGAVLGRLIGNTLHGSFLQARGLAIGPSRTEERL